MTRNFLLFLLILNTFYGCHDGTHEIPTPSAPTAAEKKVETPEPIIVPEPPVLIDQMAAPFLVPVAIGGGGRRHRNIRDMDNDSVADGIDNCVEIFNPSQRDFDCDFVGDQCDQCPYGDDTIDENNNQIPDDCEEPLASDLSLPSEEATPPGDIPVVAAVGDPFDWAEYQNAVEGSPGADAPLFEEEEEGFVYIKELHPFNNICDYDHVNASALNEINFNVSRAAGEQNTNLPPPNGFDQAIPISGLNPISNVVEVFAYIFVSETLNMVVLSFTGTETIGQLIADLIFVQVPPLGLDNTKPGMLIELGFSQLYGAVQATIHSALIPLLNDKKQFVITGHSLGGALTTLAALDFADYHPIVYTFASPRVGNPVFARSYNEIPILSNTWRIFNTEDFVATLPLPVFPLGIVNPPNYIYEHVGNPVPFTINLNTLITNHIKAYRQVFLEGIYPDNPNGICPQREDCSGLVPATLSCAH